MGWERLGTEPAARPEHEQPGRPPVVRHPSAIGLECDRFLVVLRQPIRETAAPTRQERQPDHRAPGMNESDARADVDDRALLQRMAQGDRAALATLYHGYHGRLCRRSEEHTSELQSLRRNSTAVFRLQEQSHMSSR